MADPQIAPDSGATAAGLPEGSVLLFAMSPAHAGPDGRTEVEDEEVVPLDELLVWDGREERTAIDLAIGRLASLLGIAAAVVALLILILAAGTDVASVFGSLPGPWIRLGT